MFDQTPHSIIIITLVLRIAALFSTHPSSPWSSYTISFSPVSCTISRFIIFLIVLSTHYTGANSLHCHVAVTHRLFIMLAFVLSLITVIRLVNRSPFRVTLLTSVSSLLLGSSYRSQSFPSVSFVIFLVLVSFLHSISLSYSFPYPNPNRFSYPYSLFPTLRILVFYSWQPYDHSQIVCIILIYE